MGKNEGAKAPKLEELYGRIQQDDQYRSDSMGAVFVPGTGPPEAPIALVGEAPGKDEEKAREPFVGPAGRNLDALLEGVGLSRSDVFITNLVKYRPTDSKGGNRKPTVRESRYAVDYLLEELRILDPELVVCLGSAPAAALLEDSRLKMKEASGRFYDKHGFSILVSYHPSPYNYLNADRKKAMEETFEKLKLPD